MKRAGTVESQVIGDIDERIDRPQPDRREPPLHPRRTWPIANAFDEAQRKGWGEMRVLGHEIEPDLDWTRKISRSRLYHRAFQLAKPRCREIAGDAVDAGGIGPVGQKIDLDDWVIEKSPCRISRANRRLLGQIENAVMVIGQFELGARTQHAVRFDAPNHPFAEDDLLGRNCGARRGKHRFHAGPRIRRTADDLHWGGPSGIDKRSEEHTSELQSHHDLVCRLLLEKKKKTACPSGSRVRCSHAPARRTLPRWQFPARPPLFFFFNDTATTEIYTLSLHDALPI